ncbi:hypothetical protein [Chitinimonas koreensis]|uniref:hypothetical protein n=1 Tax=Chitinimonas koreensis TaxID=356302 RepID=UPI0027E417B0|nr:hypothetical protein [Chitinimonas koreensis]
MASHTGIQPDRLAALLARERDRYAAARPRSQALARRADAHLLYGVPLHWMTDWGTPFPLFVESARGARFNDADGHDYVDFCLGDTGAMFGHARRRWPPRWRRRRKRASPPCCRARTPPWSANCWRSASACRSGSSR